jgi:hypothetical protein
MFEAVTVSIGSQIDCPICLVYIFTLTISAVYFRVRQYGPCECVVCPERVAYVDVSVSAQARLSTAARHMLACSAMHVGTSMHKFTQRNL